MIEKNVGAGGITDGIKEVKSDLEKSTDPIIEIEIEGEEAPVVEELAPFTHGKNLAESFDDDKLREIASDIMEAVGKDLNSRADWEKSYKDGLRLLGLKVEEVTKPWTGACNVIHPLLAEAVVKFQAETILETFPAAGPVKTKLIGKETKERKAAASRVQEDMNWRLTEHLTEFRQEHERLLWNLPIAGSAFKKVYYDEGLGRECSMFVPAEDFIVSYGTADLLTAERFTHRMYKSKHELDTLMRAKLYKKCDLDQEEKAPTQHDEIHTEKDKVSGLSGGQDDRYTVLEVHLFDDLEDEGYASPYVVTICSTNDKVLSIYRNWGEDDELRRRRDYFVHYPYIVGFGFYGYGLIHLIGSHAAAATSITRQLVDAGTLSNLPGGFKAKGMRITGDDTPIAPGEFRDVDVPAGDMKNNILPLPYKEPSTVLFSLLQNIVEEGRRFASVSDATIADANQQAPVGTTLALLERTLKVMSAVQARVHAALKLEFKLIKAVVKEHAPDEYPYETDPNRAVKRADYDIVEIIPVSDPNAATMAQRIMQYQAVLELAKQDPQLYDKVEIHREMLASMGVKNAARLIPSVDEQKPRDPIAENMSVLMGKPVKAFAYQDHEAHLSAHQAFMQDPKLAMLMGQNPNAQLVFNAMQAHIAEHAAYAYRRQAEMMLGVSLPDPNEEMPAEAEFQLSGLLAQAAQKVLQTNQAAMAQMKAQQAEQDPVLQLEKAKVSVQADANNVKREQIQSTEKLKIMELQGSVGQDAQKMQMEAQKMQQELAAMREKHQLEIQALLAKTEIAKIQAQQKAQEGQMKLGFEAQRQRSNLQMQQVTNQQQMAFNERNNEQKLELQKKQMVEKAKMKPAAKKPASKDKK
jgi:hypothetical protein